MTEWEYRMETLVTQYHDDDASKVASLLNRHGKAGWELVQYTPAANIGHPWTFVFKRPGPPKSESNR